MVFTSQQSKSSYLRTGETSAAGPFGPQRRNIVVIFDEAHRSQYGFKAPRWIRRRDEIAATGSPSYMRDALPASFIGFTGTPGRSQGQEHAFKCSAATSASTTFRESVEDGATVADLLRESTRQARPQREGAAKASDSSFEEITEDEEEGAQRRSPSSLNGQPSRRLVGYRETVGACGRRHRSALRESASRRHGRQGASIVCMSRRICVDLYDQHHQAAVRIGTMQTTMLAQSRS